MKLYDPMPSFLKVKKWINKKQLTSSYFDHKPTFVHFWSLSCHHCKKSIPLITHWHSQYGEEMAFISVHMPRDASDYNEWQIKHFVRKMNIQCPVALDVDDHLSRSFHNECVPSFYLFDRNKQLRHYQMSDRGLAMLKQRMIRLMKDG